MIETRIQIGGSPFSAAWTAHWGLARDPFGAPRNAYAPLPGHEAAITRLTYVIESGQRFGTICGEPGVGKSTVLDQLRRRLRAPGRRFAFSNEPIRGSDLFFELATALGSNARLMATADDPTQRIAAWKAFETAARLQTRQGMQLVLIVDGCSELFGAHEEAELRRLLNLGTHLRAPVTLILTAEDEQSLRDHPGFCDALPARLQPITRSDAEHYLLALLREAGRIDDAFTPHALNRLHAASGGLPRRIDRIASLCLIAGAAQGLEIIPPDLVDEIEHELAPHGRTPGLDSEPRFVLA